MVTFPIEKRARDLETAINDRIKRECASRSYLEWDALRDRVVEELGGDEWEFLDATELGRPPRVVVIAHRPRD